MVISVTVGRRRCSHRSQIPESFAEECETVDVVRPPCRVARISGCHGTAMRVCTEASLDERDRRSCLCSLSVTVPWWRNSGGRWSLQRVARRGTTLVTTAQVSAACFGLLSHVVRMVVCCIGCVCFCSGVRSYGDVYFGLLCTDAVFSIRHNSVPTLFFLKQLVSTGKQDPFKRCGCGSAVSRCRATSSPLSQEKENTVLSLSIGSKESTLRSHLLTCESSSPPYARIDLIA
jgi:hypothetical protein